jgi:hypothetical protein
MSLQQQQPPPGLVQDQEQALLDLVEADRARQCQAVLDAARQSAAAVQAQSRADALARLRTTFAEQRQLRHDRLAAAQARMATQRRLQQQQHAIALLQQAWQQLPGELLALWQQPGARRAWVARVLAMAQQRLPAGPWQVLHPADWPATEQQALAAGLRGARFSADPAIQAGLKVQAQGNVIDGTLAGLLADRGDFEARLLRQLERLP